MARDYYEILGIPKSASEKELRQAYRRLARKFHPDVNPGNKTAEARFKEINEAYEVLSNAETRRKYDRFGHNWKQADRFAQTGSRVGTQEPVEWTYRSGSDLRDELNNVGLGDIFDRYFGGRGSRKRRRPSIEQPVEVTLEEAFAGTTRIIEITSPEGNTPKLHRLEVKIPPGVDSGSRVRVAGPSGEEIILQVSVMPHSRFERKGNDLNIEVSVPLYEAILGGEIEVPTLKGKVLLKIPPETDNKRSFRLAGQGMPRLGFPNKRGDLLVRAQIVLPSGLSQREKEMFQELKALRSQGR
ncbi:MAG: J domain-containing protein [Chloroflexi bacterium]|nr:J domain-containing protein [Chloroflexota bacterium]